MSSSSCGFLHIFGTMCFDSNFKAGTFWHFATLQPAQECRQSQTPLVEPSCLWTFKSRGIVLCPGSFLGSSFQRWWFVAHCRLPSVLFVAHANWTACVILHLERKIGRANTLLVAGFIRTRGGGGGGKEKQKQPELSQNWDIFCFPWALRTHIFWVVEAVGSRGCGWVVNGSPPQTPSQIWCLGGADPRVPTLGQQIWKIWIYMGHMWENIGNTHQTT